MYIYVLPLDGIAYPKADRLAISAANEIFWRLGYGGDSRANHGFNFWLH
jgi:hypothetical protein